jgi:EmrB/QacA subfamily drug resistance transporter
MAQAPEDDRKGSFALLLTASLISSLIMLDSNIVAVALPAIERALHADFADVQWVISAYVLTYAALLLAAGNFADRYGRRLAMVIGLAIFAIASAACGVAPGIVPLNLARAAQGIGGALLLTSSLAVIGHAFEGAERSRATAFWGASLGIALAIGPVLGGAITSLAGWRWLFLVNVPASAILIGTTFRTIPESRDADAQDLDFPGIVTFSLGLGLLIWALIDGNALGWRSPMMVARLVGAAALFAGFVVGERRLPRPMVDLSLFKRRSFLAAVLAMLGYGASAQVMVFLLPQLLQNAYGFSALVAGLAMLPFALPMVFAPRVTGALAARYTSRLLLTGGLLTSAVGNLGFGIISWSGAGYAGFAAAMLVAGAGAGLLNGQTVKALQAAVPPERAGMASGLASTTRFIGILVSIAILGAVLANVVEARFRAMAPHAGIPAAMAGVAATHTAAGTLADFQSTLPLSIRASVGAVGMRAFAQGFGIAALIAAALAAAAAALTWFAAGEVVSGPTIDAAARAKMPCALVDCRHPL